MVALTTGSTHPQFLIQQQQTGVFPTIHQAEIYTVVREVVSQAIKKAQQITDKASYKAAKVVLAVNLKVVLVVEEDTVQLEINGEQVVVVIQEEVRLTVKAFIKAMKVVVVPTTQELIRITLQE